MNLLGILYPILDVALLWCGVNENELEAYRKGAYKTAPKMWKHDELPDLEKKIIVLQVAVNSEKLNTYRKNGTQSSCISIGQWHFFAHELKQYMIENLPDEKPPFLFGSPKNNGVIEYNTNTIHTMPLALQLANQAYVRYWGNMPDPHDTTQHKTNQVITEWIMQQAQGQITKTMADKIAQIIRPEWATTGRRKEI